MTIASVTPPVKGLRALSYPPKHGEHYLSVDLAKVDDVVKVFDLAKELGFKPELVQITDRGGDVQIHALLLHEQTNDTPADCFDRLEEQTNRLADEIDNNAIRHCCGGRLLLN
jgi:hypothetical protein